jgi:hypothetical protein
MFLWTYADSGNRLNCCGPAFFIHTYLEARASTNRILYAQQDNWVCMWSHMANHAGLL